MDKSGKMWKSKVSTFVHVFVYFSDCQPTGTICQQKKTCEKLIALLSLCTKGQVHLMMSTNVTDIYLPKRDVPVKACLQQGTHLHNTSNVPFSRPGELNTIEM